MVILVLLLRLSIAKDVLTDVPWQSVPKNIEEGYILMAGREKMTFIGTTDVEALLESWGIFDLEISKN